MKKMLYKNYGMLGHEKEAVFAETPIGEIYDKIEVDIPEELNPRENQYGDTLITLSGTAWLLNQALSTGKDDSPNLVWTDGENWHTRKLNVIA